MRSKSREGAQRAFTRIFEQTGDDSFRADSADRQLVVNLLVAENEAYAPDAPGASDAPGKFPFRFRFTFSLRTSPGRGTE